MLAGPLMAQVTVVRVVRVIRASATAGLMIAPARGGVLKPMASEIDPFITPDVEFHAFNALAPHLHVPRSTELSLTNKPRFNGHRRGGPGLCVRNDPTLPQCR